MNKNTHNNKTHNNKTVMIITSLMFPVPSVLGGAVEMLVSDLLNCNEIEKKVKFIVTSIYNKKAKDKSYSNSKVLYFKDGKIVSPLVFLWCFKWICHRIVSKMQRKKCISSFFVYQYYYLAKKENVDVVVFENVSQTERFSVLKDLVGEENIYNHLHWTRIGSLKEREAVPNSISGSEYVTNEWIKEDTTLGKNYVVYDGIDIERFSSPTIKNKAEREKLGLSEDDVVVLFCGRFIPEKGIEQLLDAFEMIGVRNIKLLLIGSANYSSATTTAFSDNIISRAKRMDNVVLLGYIPNENVHIYYGISDIMTIPTTCEESVGLVAIEGMAAGLPLIITQSGGMVEYATDDCAVKLPINDELPKALAKSIVELSKDTTRRNEMSKAGRKRAKHFSKENFYNDFIKAIIGE